MKSAARLSVSALVPQVSKTGAVGAVPDEAKTINESRSALGDVISVLATGIVRDLHLVQFVWFLAIILYDGSVVCS